MVAIEVILGRDERALDWITKLGVVDSSDSSTEEAASEKRWSTIRSRCWIKSLVNMIKCHKAKFAYLDTTLDHALYFRDGTLSFLDELFSSS